MEIVRSSWSDGNNFHDRSDEIEKIGVDHQILTPFTSMVGFDSSIKIDRTDVDEVVAQASPPAGMDPSSLFGVAKGGSLTIDPSAAQCYYMVAENHNVPMSGISTRRLSDFQNETSDNFTDWTQTGRPGGAAGSPGGAGGGKTRITAQSLSTQSFGIRDASDASVDADQSWGATTPDVIQGSQTMGTTSDVIGVNPTLDAPLNIGASGPLNIGATGPDVLAPFNIEASGSLNIGSTGPLAPLSGREEASLLLSNLLNIIRDMKSRGEILDPLVIINGWVENYGLMAVVIACTALKDGGCSALAIALMQKCKTGANPHYGDQLDEVEDLVKEIAAEISG